MTAAVDWIAVAGDAAPWLRLGLLSAHVDEDGCEQIPLFGTGVEIDTTARPGVHPSCRASIRS